MIGFKIDFLLILGGCWKGLREGLGDQVGLKINKKSIWKDDEFFGGILVASWRHLEASWKILEANQKKDF